MASLVPSKRDQVGFSHWWFSKHQGQHAKKDQGIIKYLQFGGHKWYKVDLIIIFKLMTPTLTPTRLGTLHLPALLPYCPLPVPHPSLTAPIVPSLLFPPNLTALLSSPCSQPQPYCPSIMLPLSPKVSILPWYTPTKIVVLC